MNATALTQIFTGFKVGETYGVLTPVGLTRLGDVIALVRASGGVVIPMGMAEADTIGSRTMAIAVYCETNDGSEAAKFFDPPGKPGDTSKPNAQTTK